MIIIFDCLLEFMKTQIWSMVYVCCVVGPCYGYGICETFEELKYENSMHTHSRWLNLHFSRRSWSRTDAHTNKQQSYTDEMKAERKGPANEKQNKCTNKWEWNEIWQIHIYFTIILFLLFCITRRDEHSLAQKFSVGVRVHTHTWFLYFI